jgi:sugar phosphate isomerase/epimerase
MRPALHTVSYAGVWPGQARLPLEAVLDKAASLGFQGIMLMAKRPHASILDLDRRARTRLRKALEGRGLALACMAAYTNFTAGTDHPGVPFQEMQVRYVEELAAITAELGGSVIRVFTGWEAPGVHPEVLWDWCVSSLRECARRTAPHGVTIAVQNHHDIASHHLRMRDLLEEIDEPNCKAAFDAWAPALQGVDLREAVLHMRDWIVHTTVADYVKRPRYHLDDPLVNFLPRDDMVAAVPPGEGFIDYQAFFAALNEIGYQGWVAFEMCSRLKGGGSEENLDRVARTFLDFLPKT